MNENFYIVTATIIPVLILSTAISNVIDIPRRSKRERAKGRFTMRLVIFVNFTAVLSLFRCMTVLLFDLQARTVWEPILIYAQLGLLTAVNTAAVLLPYMNKLGELKEDTKTETRMEPSQPRATIRHGKKRGLLIRVKSRS